MVMVSPFKLGLFMGKVIIVGENSHDKSKTLGCPNQLSLRKRVEAESYVIYVANY